MATSLIHLKLGLIPAFFLLIGIILPDIEKVFQKGFFENRCYEGFFKDRCKARDFLKTGLFHDWVFWAVLIMVSFGAIVHIIMDGAI